MILHDMLFCHYRMQNLWHRALVHSAALCLDNILKQTESLYSTFDSRNSPLVSPRKPQRATYNSKRTTAQPPPINLINLITSLQRFRLIVSNQNFPGFDTVGRTDDALFFHDFNDAGGPVIADAQVPLDHGN